MAKSEISELDLKWWQSLVTFALGKLRQKDLKLKAGLGYINSQHSNSSYVLVPGFIQLF